MNLSRLPGLGCAHYASGRCLYAEHLNPGLETAYLCVELARHSGDLDDFVIRAEAFGLNEAKAGEIWRKRLAERLAQDCRCQDYLPGDNDNFLGCALGLGELCLKALPPCQGRCRLYAPFSTCNKSEPE